MTAFLNRIHARVGDLWWYSAMLFIACRSGDVIQAFIGLWLVPKYVGPNELGAVLPLQQLSSFFTVPLAIVAVVFSKYVNTYATRGELGKVKSFIHDVILLSAGLMILCIAAAYWLIPHFYSRLNIAAGSLTVLVLASGFVGNISGLFGSALQGLKKFKTMTVQSLISAPIRLVTLLIAMPFRPLSGYLLGQTTPAASCCLLAALTMHRDLKKIPVDKTWRNDLSEIGRYLWPIAIFTSFGTLFATIQATVYRQRLPEIESSAYYILSRFSEIASYVGQTMIIVLIPLASEAHEKGSERPELLRHTLIGTGITTAFFCTFFALFGKSILNASPVWGQYSNFVQLLPWMTLITGSSALISSTMTYEMACRRFRMPFYIIFVNFVWTCFIITFTGYDFFRGILPCSIVDWMESIHLSRLTTMTRATIIVQAIQFVTIPFFLSRSSNKS